MHSNQPSIWMLKNSPSILEFLYVFKDNKKVFMVNEIIGAFKEQVLSIIDHLKSGMYDH